MSEPKHTAGEWSNYPWQRIGPFIYQLKHAGWRKGEEQFRNRFSALVQPDGNNTTKEELEAIAALMCAAPELLAALKELHDLCINEVSGYDYSDSHNRARAAIAKAQPEETKQ